MEWLDHYCYQRNGVGSITFDQICRLDWIRLWRVVVVEQKPAFLSAAYYQKAKNRRITLTNPNNATKQSDATPSTSIKGLIKVLRLI